MPVKLNPPIVIKTRLGLQSKGPVEAFAASTCAKHMNKYVPMRDGNLRQYKIEQNKIVYDSPYAHAQYVGYTKGQVQNYTTPGTGPYWDERMKSAEMPDVIREVQAFINRGGK